MSEEKKSTFFRKLRRAARSLLLTNALVTIVALSNLVPWHRPPNTPREPEPPSVSELLQKNEWERNLRDDIIRIQNHVEIDRQKLSTDKLDQRQLLNTLDSLISSADKLKDKLAELKNQPSPKNLSKTTEFQAFKQSVERLQKYLIDIRSRLDKEKRRLVDGASADKTGLYELTDSLAELTREILELKNFFLFSDLKHRYIPKVIMA